MLLLDMRQNMPTLIDMEKRNMNNKGRILTCVYCGEAYPQDTPTWGDEVLTEHIKVCPKHPLREAERKIEILKKALIGLVGVETREELEQMEIEVRSLPAHDSVKVPSIIAIHTLLETM